MTTGLLRIAPHRLLAIGVACVAVYFLIVSLDDAVPWIGRSYPGFLLYPNGIVSAIQPLGKEAREGLTFPGYVTGVDGQSVRTSDEVYSIVRTKAVGQEVAYSLVHGGTSISVRVPVKVFTVRDFASLVGLSSLTGIICVGIGILFLWLSRLDGPARYLTGVSLSFGFFALFNLDFLTMHRFVPLYHLSIPLQPVYHTLFGLSFPEERALRRNKAFNIFVWVFAGLLLIAHSFFLRKPGAYGVCNLIAVMGVIIGVSTTVSSTLYSYRFSISLEVRKRAKIVTWGFCLAIVMFVPFLVLSWFYGVSWANFMWTGATVFVGFFLSYAILKHNIFEVDEALRKLTSYFITISTVTALYVGLLSTLNFAFSRVGVGQIPSAVVSALFMVFVFIPLRDVIKRFVDRTFFRERYELERAFERIMDAMSSIIVLDKLLNVLLSSLSDALHLIRAGIMLPSGDGGFAVTARLGSGGTIAALPGGHPLLLMVDRTREPVLTRDVEPGREGRAIATALKDLAASVVVPLVYRERLVGLMSLGEKQSGAEYVREDLRLLRVFARQAAIAIENARLIEEEKKKERMAQELSSARKIQMGLLPQKDPVVDGVEVAGASLSAKEVGGDYYDYIPLPAGGIGVAVGDVAGKGVPAALVMTMVKAVFESHEEAVTKPADMLRRLGMIARRSRTMVTFFYCVLDPVLKVIRFSNAGHLFPYLLRDGAVEFLSELSNLPLGMDPENAYRELQADLRSGDTVILYTDGIVEARNGRDFFGFERFEESIRGCAGLPADGMKEKIMAVLGKFCGDQEPSDDMTLVIIRIQ